MRHMKKLVAVLLTAVMVLTMLTACGGSGGGSSSGMSGVFNFTAAELTQKLNTDMKSNARYDSNLGPRFATAMNAAMSATAGLTKEEAERVAESIMTSAGFADSDCATTVIEKNSTVEEAASGLEDSIEKNNLSLNNKTIGYAGAQLKGNGNYYMLFIIIQ